MSASSVPTSEARSDEPSSDPLLDVPPERIPRHLAVNMDGNGRWAVRRGLERVRGLEAGAR